MRVHGHSQVSSEPAYEAILRDFESAATSETIARLSSEQRERLGKYWLDRATGELTTALTFEFMLADLTEEDAPASLLDLARRAISDEHLHADWCLRWAERVDPERPVRPRVSGMLPLIFDGASEHDNRLLRTIFGCCFSETVAVHVLAASHPKITLESVHRLNQQHLKEEMGHARLGWALLGWSGITARDRDMIGAYVPEMVRLTRRVWQSTRRAGEEELHQLGYLSSSIVDPACDDALENVTMPGLRHLGIT
jgi:hypothetical protein